MSDQLIDVRTTLAASRQTRVEIGNDGVLHVLAGAVTLHLERGVCEDLATTLARAMVILARTRPRRKPPALALVPVPAGSGIDGSANESSENESSAPSECAAPQGETVSDQSR